jgi:hypothetical protein
MIQNLSSLALAAVFLTVAPAGDARAWDPVGRQNTIREQNGV